MSSRAKADTQTAVQGKKTKTNACTSGQLKCLNSFRVFKFFLKNNSTSNLEQIYNLRLSLQGKLEIILFITNNQLIDLVTIYHQIWLLLFYLPIIKLKITTETEFLKKIDQVVKIWQIHKNL